MEVIITKKHCKSAYYGSITDCPLARAIKEQHPEFPLCSVAGTYVRDKDKNIFDFDRNKWNNEAMTALIRGDIDKIELILTNSEKHINSFYFPK